LSLRITVALLAAEIYLLGPRIVNGTLTSFLALGMSVPRSPPASRCARAGRT
jgi:hypothetical protein